MTRIDRTAFRDCLGELSPSELVAFVAALWDARGWNVEVDGRLVRATRSSPTERTRTLFVETASADDPPGGVDAVVAGRRRDGDAADRAAALDADLVDADDLYDLVLYGLDPATADALLERFFDRPARTDDPATRPDPDGDDDGDAGQAGGGEPTSTRRRALIVLAVAALLLAAVSAAWGLVGAPGTVLPDSPATSGPDPTTGHTPVASTPVSEPTTTARTPTRRATTSDAGAATGVAPVDQPRYLGLEPTCDRPPGLVIKIQLGALRNNNETDAGISTAWRFASPENRRAIGSYRTFVYIIRSDTYSPMLRFERAVYGPLERENGTARQRVTLIDADGSRATYAFVLERQTAGEHEGCWMTSGVFRTDTGGTSS